MTSKRRFKLIAAVVLLVVPPLLAAIAGWLVSPWFLHPVRRELTAQLIGRADSVFQLLHATREDFSVRAPDGVTLYGWKVRPANPNGCWVLLFHGVADNRMGVIGHAEMLLRSGYSVVMMDARAHGASEGAMATYGWLEREDSKSTLDALLVSEREPAIDVQTSAPYPSGDSGKAAPVAHVFSLGESMGAGIALQSAEIDPRIEGVVAEASFATLREASYDYAACANRRSSARPCSRPLVGRCYTVANRWPVSRPPACPRNAPLLGDLSRCSSSAMKTTLLSLAAIPSESTLPPRA